MTEDIQKSNKRIAVYARVSTSNQEDQKTIEAQLSEVRAFAEKESYTIVKEYLDEGWSGDILARPSLDQLRADARNNIWQAVLIYDPDRLGRRLFYQQIVIDELKQLEIEILFVTTPPIKNESDELMFGVRGLFAQYEKAKIAERFRIGKVNRVKNNQILVSEAPYGYNYILNKGKRGSADYVVGHYEVNEQEAQIVRNIFSWVADEGLTLRGVVRRLQELAIPPRKSKRGVWSTSTLSTLLRNKTYIGEAHYGASYAVVPINPFNKGDYKKIKKTSRKMKPVDEWIPISVTAIIDQELFMRVGVQLETNFALCQRNKKNEYLLAGKIWCSCGSRRAGEGPQRGKHLYYRCSGRVNKFPLVSECIEKGVNARVADEMVWRRLARLMSTPELLIKEAERWADSRNNKTKPSTINIEETKKEIAKSKEQENRYAKAYGIGAITIDQLKEYSLPIRERVSSLEEQIRRAQAESDEVDKTPPPNGREIEIFAEKVSRSLSDLNFERKRDIVMNIIERVVGTREKLQVYGHIPITNVGQVTIHRHCRPAKCGEVHALQCADEEVRAG